MRTQIKFAGDEPDPEQVMDWVNDLDPLQAAPRLTPAPPEVRRAAIRAQRLLVAGAVACVVAAGVGLAAFLCAGFARRELAAAAALALAAGIPLCTAGSSGSNAAVRAAGYKSWPGVVGVIQPGFLLEPETPALPSTVLLLVLPFLFVLSVGLTPGVVAAQSLLHPTIGTALASPDPVATTFRTVDGNVVSTRLAGLMGPTSDGVGTAVVYDAGHPTHAMAGSDYRRDSSGRRLAGLLLTLLLQAGIVTWTMSITRSRRRAYGDGRPNVPILSVETISHVRGPDSWRVTYADGLSVRFPCTPRQRQALLRRIEDDPGGYHPGPTVWKALTEPSLRPLS